MQGFLFVTGIDTLARPELSFALLSGCKVVILPVSQIEL